MITITGPAMISHTWPNLHQGAAAEGAVPRAELDGMVLTPQKLSCSKQDPRTDGPPPGLRRTDVHLGIRSDFQPFKATHTDAIALWAFSGVHDLQTVDVLQLSTRHDARQRRPITHHIHLQRRACDKAGHHAYAQGHQDRAVYQHTWPQHTAQDLRLTPPFGHAALRRKPDEPARILHLVHHGIAGVHTQATADAFVLQALANVDAHRAHLHTQRAVNAIAQPLGLVVDVLLARPTLLAAFWVVGNDQRVLVEHGALKARIGTHVFAHLFAHVAGIAIGGKAIEQYPENLPATLHRQQ